MERGAEREGEGMGRGRVREAEHGEDALQSLSGTSWACASGQTKVCSSISVAKVPGMSARDRT